jgi:hypothetical protein
MEGRCEIWKHFRVSFIEGVSDGREASGIWNNFGVFLIGGVCDGGGVRDRARGERRRNLGSLSYKGSLMGERCGTSKNFRVSLIRHVSDVVGV